MPNQIMQMGIIFDTQVKTALKLLNYNNNKKIWCYL